MKAFLDMKKLITAVAGVALAVGLTARTASAGSRTVAFLLDTRADELAEVLPASCTYSLGEDEVLTVKFAEGVSGQQFVLPDNMGLLAFDLNGQKLVGAAGAAGSALTAGGNGSWVFQVGSDTAITVLDSTGSSGRITGGAGGNGQPVGKGASAFVDSDGAQFAVTDEQGLVSKGADGELMRCSLTFDMQGGEGGTESVTVTYGEVPAAIEVPARTGYLFKGVYTEPEGEGTQVYDETGTASAPWAIAEEAKLYAFWQGVPPEFTLVSAKQRWPWNGKVDLVYTVKDLRADTAYWLVIAVKASGKEASVRVGIPSENGTKSLVVDLDAMLPAETQDVAAQLNVKLIGVE